MLLLPTLRHDEAHYSFLCVICSNPLLVTEVTAKTITEWTILLLHGSFTVKATTVAVYALLRLRRSANTCSRLCDDVEI